MGMSYQVEELVVPALAHVVGSGIMYVPNGSSCMELGGTSDSITNISA
jgi:hypothetical protein